MRRVKTQPSKPSVWKWLVLSLSLLTGSLTAHAGVPRFLAGAGWGVSPGSSVTWQRGTLAYYTDPGPLSASVDHATADTMVAAAAAEWNVPMSSIALSQGGELSQDIDSTNFYDGPNGPVLPPDLQLSNEAAMPLAIVYDADGSVLDSMMGTGASDPASCRSNAVVGDVDHIDAGSGSIRHATLILNGLCAGPTNEQMLEMRYQLARAFGRILGLSWSQNNDNVFTAQSPVTKNQMAYWPLMHPLDVLCSPLPYQCMVQPFQLRPDDLNTLVGLYPVASSQAVNGKEASSGDALYFWGLTYFMTQQSMGWMNITVRRQNQGIYEDWQTTSEASGFMVRQQESTPIAPGSASNYGTPDHDLDGYFIFRRIPLNGISNVFITDEPINPLYMGDAAIGPYLRPPITPSGSPVTVVEWSAIAWGDGAVWNFLHKTDGASTCSPGADGSESAAAAVDPSGWQPGQLCGPGHNSWWSVPVAAGHSWTMEVTSTDEAGNASGNKAQPVMGMWNVSDPTGTAPTVASQAVPFNSLAYGTTTMQMPAADADQNLRISVSDQYGQGRPDFTYVARVLYASSVTPQTLGSSGGQIVIQGTGFREGMQVLVGGTPAEVVSGSATQLVANVPALAAVGASTGVPVDLQVVDPATGGSTSIAGALTYQQLSNVVQVVSMPAAVTSGEPTAQPVVFQVLSSDGLVPVTGEPVTLAVSEGTAGLAICGGAATCQAMTDANGQVGSLVTGGAAGVITVTISDGSGANSFVQLMDTDPDRHLSISSPVHYVAAGASGSWEVQVQATENGLQVPGLPVNWSFAPGVLPQLADAATGSSGAAQMSVLLQDIAAGSVNTVHACAWGVVCADWTAFGVEPAQWALQTESGGMQAVGQSAPLAPVVIDVVDAAGHPLELAPVQVYQRVLAWQTLCEGEGRCPAAQVLSTSVSTLTSDGEGRITITPLQAGNVPQSVEIAVSTGVSAQVTTTLQKMPEPQ